MVRIQNASRMTGGSTNALVNWTAAACCRFISAAIQDFFVSFAFFCG
jgi:hypothetical protein